MNKRMVLYFIGWIFKIEAICMLLPIFTALFYKEVQVKDFIFTAILCLVLGLIISAKKQISSKPAKPVRLFRKGV